MALIVSDLSGCRTVIEGFVHQYYIKYSDINTESQDRKELFEWCTHRFGEKGLDWRADINYICFRRFDYAIDFRLRWH